MSLADEQWEALELARGELHVRNNEPGELVFLGRSATDNSLTTLCTIKKAWRYLQDNNLLRNGALYELRVSEKEITATDIDDFVAIRHGDLHFLAVQPTPLRPNGLKRYWIFWLMPSQGEI